MPVPTPHNEAKLGDIAKVVLMPGDPLRAKYVAEHYLEHPVCFNTVRNMFGYTGTLRGRRVSVMGHGMGIPSITLYAWELYNFYGVESIIRIGSAGGVAEDVHAVRDGVVKGKVGGVYFRNGNFILDDACALHCLISGVDLDGHLEIVGHAND